MIVYAKCKDCGIIKTKANRRCKHCQDNFLDNQNQSFNALYLKALNKLNGMDERQLKNFVRRNYK